MIKKIIYTVETEGNLEVGLTFNVELVYILDQDIWVATPSNETEDIYAIAGVGRTTHEAILDVIANRLFKHNIDEEV